MPRLKKPASQRLAESINTPVRHATKRLAVRVAKAKGLNLTELSRSYIEQGLARDGKLVESTTAATAGA